MRQYASLIDLHLKCADRSYENFNISGADIMQRSALSWPLGFMKESYWTGRDPHLGVKHEWQTKPHNLEIDRRKNQNARWIWYSSMRDLFKLFKSLSFFLNLSESAETVMIFLPLVGLNLNERKEQEKWKRKRKTLDVALSANELKESSWVCNILKSCLFWCKPLTELMGFFSPLKKPFE